MAYTHPSAKKTNENKEEAKVSPVQVTEPEPEPHLDDKTKENIVYLATGISILIFSMLWWNNGASICHQAVPSLDDFLLKIVSDIVYICIVGIIYFLFVEKFGMSGQMPGVLIIVVLFLLLDGINYYSYLEKVKEKNYIAPREQLSDTITIDNPCSFYFKLKPHEMIKNNFEISDKLRYHLSSSADGHDYYMFRENKQPFHIYKDNMKLPDSPGKFKIINGSKETTITLITVLK